MQTPTMTTEPTKVVEEISMHWRYLQMTLWQHELQQHAVMNTGMLCT